MASATSQRIYLGLVLPQILHTAVAETAVDEQRSVSAVVRRAIDWHRGIVKGRHPDSKQYTLPRIRKKQPKSPDRTSFAIDPAAVEYLEQRGGQLGMPKSSMIVLILHCYFDLLDLEPLPQSTKK